MEITLKITLEQPANSPQVDDPAVVADAVTELIQGGMVYVEVYGEDGEDDDGGIEIGFEITDVEVVA